MHLTTNDIYILCAIGSLLSITILYVYLKRHFGKHVSFSKKNDINFIPTNNEMSDHKEDLYYSPNDFRSFSDDLRFENSRNSLSLYDSLISPMV